MSANITRWIPFRTASLLQDEIDCLLESAFGDGRSAMWTPALDIEETKDNIIVRAELPGMKKEDIKVSLEGDQLRISGERRSEAEQKDRTFYRAERAYGRFQRTLTLPSDVKSDKISAVYSDGVLELALPKAEAAKAKEIEIQ